MSTPQPYPEKRLTEPLQGPTAVYIPAISDTVDDANGPFRTFQCGVSGDISVVTVDGQVVTIPSCIAGVQYCYNISRVRSTGTTAGTIVCGV